MPQKRPENNSDGTPPSPSRAERTTHDLRDVAQWKTGTPSNMGDGVITTDAHGKVAMLNPVARALTGWTQEQAVGHPLEKIFRIINQEARTEVKNPALRALKEDVTVELTSATILISKDGSERSIEVRAAPIRSNDGKVVGSALGFRDISGRIQERG